MGTGNDCARLAFPLDLSLEKLLPHATRFYLRLHPLPPRSTRFILERVLEATRRLIPRRREPPVRVRVTFRKRSGRVQVALRVPRDTSTRGRLASLTRNAPAQVGASFHCSLHGATLQFTADGLGDDC